METSPAGKWTRRWHSRQNARTDIINFYAPNEFKEYVWPKFRRICATEGISASDKIRDLVNEYVRLHDSGNPQTRIDIITRIGKPYRANACLDCGKNPRYEAVINGVKVFLCQLDLDKRKKREALQAWKKLEKR